MKPTCLTPGCTQETGHEPTPHGDVYARQKMPDYVATGPTGAYSANMPAMPQGEPTRFVERPQYTNLPPRPVTLEGLAAVISACGSAIHAIGDWDGKAMADGHLLALIAKAREVACGKAETGAQGGDITAWGKDPKTAGEAVAAIHQRIAAMPADELERRAEAIAARDDAAHNARQKAWEAAIAVVDESPCDSSGMVHAGKVIQALRFRSERGS